MIRNILIFIFCCSFVSFVLSQGNHIPITSYCIIDDSVPCFFLPTVVVEAEMKFKNAKDKERWNKLKYNVKKVYPYAIIASARLKECDNYLKTLTDEKTKEKYIDEFEEELQREFSDELKKLTLSQGRILIKLIHRETGSTSYDLVKRMRGSFSAFMWQSLAKLFGSNLKKEYDSKGEDQLIEIAIRQVEAGAF